MASFADMIYGTAQNAAQEQGKGFAESLQQGAQLALKKEELGLQQQHMQLQMQQLQQTKVQKLYDFMGQAHNYTNGQARNNYLQMGQAYASSMGLDPSILPDHAVQGMGADENMGRDTTARNMVAGGLMTPEQYFSAKRDPEAWAKIPVTPPEAVDMGKMDMEPVLSKYMQQQTGLREAAIRSAGQVPADIKELQSFGEKVANPSSRSALGRPKMMMDAADSIKQLTDSELPPNATKAQRVAVYNQLDSRQVTEVVKGLDRLLSQANPTVHGNETLTPPTTTQALLAKWGEKLGNVPEGTTQGEFIDRMMQTVNRERAMNQTKYQQASDALKIAYPLASAKHGKKMDEIIAKTVAAPNVGGPQPGAGGSGKVSFMGFQWTPQQLQQKIDANPNHPSSQAAREALRQFQAGGVAGGP